MNAKNAKVAIPPKGKYSYLTAGEKYQILRPNTLENKISGFYIIDDDGYELFCFTSCCGHINNKKWILRNK